MTDITAGEERLPWGHRVTVAAVAAITGGFYGLSKSEFRGLSHSNRVVRPRQVAAMLMREFVPNPDNPKRAVTTEGIGRYFGLDHSSVINSCKRAAGYEKAAPEIAQDIALLRERIIHWRDCGIAEITPKDWAKSRAYGERAGREAREAVKNCAASMHGAQPMPILPVGVTEFEGVAMRKEFKNTIQRRASA